MRWKLAGLALFVGSVLPDSLLASASPRSSTWMSSRVANDARANFVTHCATCHGERGDGKGVTPLARPARSFLDGGFSYGNTRTAILRTLTHGIPGTPMPGFRVALTDAERSELVEYVISLGPERNEVEPAETVIEVGDRPLFVRGSLPALQPGAVEVTHGLLLGMPTGTSFQYRTDDVRLIAVRQGGFVEHPEWVGRGGQPLRPLGGVTHARSGGNPGATFREHRADGEPEPLAARLRGTWIEGEAAGLDYALLRAVPKERAGGEVAATVREAPRAVQTSVGAGFARRFTLHGGALPVVLDALVIDVEGARAVEHSVTQRRFGDREKVEVLVLAAEDGAHTFALWRGSPFVTLQTGSLRVDLAANAVVELELFLLTAVDGSQATRSKIIEELVR